MPINDRVFEGISGIPEFNIIDLYKESVVKWSMVE